MKLESPSPAPLARRAPSRLRKWLKRLLWTGLGLFLILLIFQRPILRIGADYGAKSAARSGGMELNWTLDGTVVSGVDLKNVTIKGDSNAPIRNLKAEHVRVGYGLWRLLKGETGSFVDEVVMENVDLDMDPSKFSKRDPDKPRKETAPPAISIPRLRLQNVNARITLPDGDVVVRGLNLTLEQGKDGALQIDELTVPWAGGPLHDVAGTTRADAAKISLSALRLDKDAMVSVLSLDLGRLSDRKASMEIKALLSGSTSVEAAGTVSEIGRKPVIDASLSVDTVAPTTLSPWIAQPPGFNWSSDGIKASVRGPLGEPRSLYAAITVKGSGVTYGALNVDRVVADVLLENGTLTLRALDLTTGSNRLTASGTAPMPETWPELTQTPFTAVADVRFPAVGEFFAGTPPVTGQLNGKLTGTFRGVSLVEARADLQGTRWVAQGVPVESMEIAARTDGKELRIEKARAMLDAANTVEATGSLGFGAGTLLTASWQIDLPNMERLATWTGRSETPVPDAGWLKGTGNVAGRLADWQRLDFSKTTGDVKLDANAVAWKTGRMESLAVEATVDAGRANLRQFTAVLNDNNRVAASGGGTLAPPWDFSAKVTGDLSQLKDFNGWLQAIGAERVLSGKAVVNWEGSGRVQDFYLLGGGTVRVESLKTTGMNEPASVSLKTSHSGRRADVSVFDASVGDFKVSAPFVLTDTFLEIPALKLTAGNLPPVEGRAKVPLDFTQESVAGPVAATGELALALSVKGMDLAEAARSAGIKQSAKGRVDADMKITGTIANPSADIALKVQGLAIPDIKQKINPADGTVTLTLKNGRLSANAEVNQKPLQPASATASMPFDLQKVLRNPQAFLETPLDASVTLPDSDLNGLRQFIPGVASMKGTVGVTAKVSGTLAKPTITGSARAAAATISFSDPDVPNARDVRLNVRFAGKQVVIDEARALMAGGNLGARGTVDWTDAANPKIDATLSAKEALILRDENMSMRADGNIVCRGSLTQAQVTGRVELVRGRVYKEIEFLPLSLPNQLPPAPPAVTVDKSDAPTLPPPLDKWTFAVEIVTRDPVRLLGNVLNGGVVSNLRLTGTGANLVLEGKATLQDSRVRLPFSRMTISRGDIIFKKEKPFQPELDVQGDAFINNYQITLNAYGPALDPKLRFSSSPPLSEGEIATLLATGSTSGDLRSSQGEAANRAAFLLLSQAYRKLFRKAGHTRIDDEPPRLSFSFSLLNNAGGSRSVSAVYEISDRLQAVGSISQAGSFRGLLYYLIRFR